MTVSDNCTAGSVFETLLKEFPKLTSLKDVMMVAVNEEHAGLDAKLSDGDVLALFPPVSGG
jgi:molybdopterin converting factor small subunit